jgi:hypothetical protein
MADYLFLYRNGPPTFEPKAMQAQMQKWGAWLKEMGEKGHLKDPGQPLERKGKLVQGKDRTVTDGPFAEAKDIIGGFSIVEARDLAHAAELSAGCPIFEVGGGVEVRPIMKM